jgi:hypothetical protein
MRNSVNKQHAAFGCWLLALGCLAGHGDPVAITRDHGDAQLNPNPSRQTPV